MAQQTPIPLLPEPPWHYEKPNTDPIMTESWGKAAQNGASNLA